jgi:hypothetical protein
LGSILTENFSCFLLLIIIPCSSILMLPLPHKVCDHPGHAAHYHNLGLYVGGLHLMRYLAVTQ